MMVVHIDWDGEEPTEETRRAAREKVAIHARSLDEEFMLLEQLGLM